MSTTRKLTFATLGLLVLGVILSIYVPEFFKVGKPPVSVKAEAITHLGGFTVTNSLLLTLIVTVFLIVVAVIATRKLRSGDEQALREPRGLQNVVELVVEAFYNVMASVSPKYVGRFFVIVATIFFLVLPSNWFGLIPGVGSFGGCYAESTLHEEAHPGEPMNAEEALASQKIWGDYSNNCARSAHTTIMAQINKTDDELKAEPEARAEYLATAMELDEAGQIAPFFHPFLRSGSADLNLTLALALISFLVTEFWGFKHLGVGYLRKFFNFSGGPIGFFVGLIELVSEFARIVSFTFRLFGNIFAGEVVLMVMAFLVPFALSLPFYGLEVFVGFIQAFVFAMLTMAFIDLAAESHDDHGDGEHAH